MLQALKKFAAAREGNFAVVGSITMIPLLAGIGLAVDYSSALNQRTHMQGALDAAALMAIGLPLTATATERQTALQNAYLANGGVGNSVVLGDLVISGDLATLNTRADYTLPTMMLQLMNRKSVALGVAASVSKRKSVQDAQFEAIGATGVWSKSVVLMGRASGATSYAPLLKLQYDFNGVHTNPVAIGSMTTSIPAARNRWTPVLKLNCDTARIVSQCYKEVLKTGAANEIDISAMEDVYLEFKVWATDKIGQVYLGGKNGPTINSNDPANSDRMFVDGVQQPPNTPVNIQSAIGCGDWQEQRWEDGGGYQGTTAWDGADFRYKVKGRCEWGKNVGIALSK